MDKQTVIAQTRTYSITNLYVVQRYIKLRKTVESNISNKIFIYNHTDMVKNGIRSGLKFNMLCYSHQQHENILAR